MKRSCNKIRKHLIAFLTRQLEEKRVLEVKEHLAGCPRCGGEAEELQAAWDFLGAPFPEDDFKDIAPGVLAGIKSAEHKTNLLGKFLTILVRAPVPALGTLIVLLALPAGIYLGKNLYLNTAYALYPAEGISAEAEELPLEIFHDFPRDSIGSVYASLGIDG